jgi:hypothetical protein
MITKLILGIIHFPEWLKTMKTKNKYLFYGTWVMMMEILALVFNFFTFRNDGVYFVLMLLIPICWTLSHIVYLAFIQRNQSFTSIVDAAKTFALPMTSSVWTDLLGSMAILFMVRGFSGSENDYLFVLVLALLVKGMMRFGITKLPKKVVIYVTMFFLMVSLLLSIAIYSFAATV